jgi:acetyl-CoA C-acetyltransferase
LIISCKEKKVERIAIVSAVRTPIGSYLGVLKDVPAYDLVAAVLNAVIKKADVKAEEVEDVIFGQCYQSGEYVNIARRGLLQAGWPVTVPGITLDRRCTSGMDALVIGAMQIQTGNSEIVVAGGVESMSTAEFYFPGNIKWGIGRGNGISYPDAPRGHGSLKMYGILYMIGFNALDPCINRPINSVKLSLILPGQRTWPKKLVLPVKNVMNGLSAVTKMR